MLIGLAALLSALVTGCSSTEPLEYITGDEADKVTQAVEPMAQNILTGIETNDYALFSTDFNESMKKGLPEESFSTLVNSFGKLGVSKKLQLLNIEDQGDYYGVNFGIAYSSSTVTMRVVLAKSDLTKVSGLWFK